MSDKLDNIKRIEAAIAESEKARKRIKSSSLSDDMKKTLYDDLITSEALLKRMKATPPSEKVVYNEVKINNKLLFILIIIFFGAIIDGTMGDNFIFVYNDFFVKNKEIILIIFSLLLFIPTIFYIESYPYKNDWMFRNWMTRWLITFPISLLLFSFMTYSATLGWSAFLTNILGKNVQSAIVKLNDFSIEKSDSDSSDVCEIIGHIEFNSQIKEICLSDMYDGTILKKNMAMIADGKKFFLGFYINKLYVVNE
jgi:hypothetical protein